MIRTIVKIDLCGSKKFAASREAENPAIRTEALAKLVELSGRCFPGGADRVPRGSFYKPDGDAVYYILEKPTVALRGSIEFMQDWYVLSQEGLPDCRVIIDHGYLDQVQVPGGIDYVGKPFENIAVIEKSLGDGTIYLTDAVANNSDRTMAQLLFYEDYTPRPNEKVSVFAVNFLDPRTTTDSSLVHALFVAHPKLAEARERIFELFFVECLLERGTAGTLEEILEQIRKKNYSLPPSETALKLLRKSELIDRKTETGREVFQLRLAAIETIQDAKREFNRAQEDCVSTVREAIRRELRADSATDGVNLSALIEQYLCAVFSEIRMMANYFRDTGRMFSGSPELFQRYTHIIRRNISTLNAKYVPEWERGFLVGLKEVSEKNNLYIAAVFHNVLATYYLNRGTQSSPYQVEKLRRRELYIDTNVLYSFLVPASPYHQIVVYLFERLKKLGVSLKVFLFTLEEYETSIENAAKHYVGGQPSAVLVWRNPWIYQEFKLHQGKYLNSMAVCRREHSITKGMALAEPNLEMIQTRLAALGLHLVSSFKTYPKEEVEGLWITMRNAMASSKWDLYQYWEFIHKKAEVSDEIIRHDVFCVQNLQEESERSGRDELGPRVLFLSVDVHKVLRLRKLYEFIIGVNQCVEFVLPYLFLSDIPTEDADKFPNQLLSAQLGTLLVKRPPAITEIVSMYFNATDWQRGNDKSLASHAEEFAEELNTERFQEVIKRGRELDPETRQELIETSAAALAEIESIKRQAYFSTRDLGPQLEATKEQLLAAEKAKEELEAKVEKLRKTVKYWQSEAQRKNR